MLSYRSREETLSPALNVGFVITKLVKDQERFWHQNYSSPKKFLKAEMLKLCIIVRCQSKLSPCRRPAQVKRSLKSSITLSVGLSWYVGLMLFILYRDDFFLKWRKDWVRSAYLWLYLIRQVFKNTSILFYFCHKYLKYYILLFSFPLFLKRISICKH